MSRPSPSPVTPVPARAVAALLIAVAAAGCGKKGPPLPPLQRVPADVKGLEALRVGDDAYVTFTVPETNVGGDSPADLSRVEVYAFTTDGAADGLDPTRAGRVVASVTVRRPLPPPPPPEPGQPAPPPLPERPGVDQGAIVTIRETLGAEQRLPIAPAADAGAPARATWALAPGIARRYYVAVPVSPRGRLGGRGQRASVPLLPGTSAPPAPAVAYDATAITVSWTAAPDAHVALAPVEGVLPSKPLVAPPPPTRYNVYRAEPAATEAVRPAPLNPEPLAGPPLSDPGMEVGVERCYVVRPVDTVDGTVVVGPASPPGCVTPRDTFPPAAPRTLAAVAGAGAISLIWEANDEADLAGYVVLRGEAPGAELRAITTEPIRETTFRDTSVQPGVRYVYAVVAVDRATPQNVSAQSNRVEETARQ